MLYADEAENFLGIPQDESEVQNSSLLSGESNYQMITPQI